MECPNCRKIEKGQWLYSNGSRSYAESDMEDWAHDENPYDPSHSEMTSAVHWSPVNGFMRLPSSFGRGLLSLYRGVIAEHAMVVEPIEPTDVSSGSHHWPHVAYSGPYSSSLHSSGSVSNGSTFSSHWNNQSASTSSHVAGPDQPSSPSMTQRVAGDNFGMPRSGSFVHPSAVDHGTGSSVSTSMPTPYPDSAARSRERMLALQPYFQRPPGNSQGDSTTLVPSARRLNGDMNLTQGEPGAAVSAQATRTGSSVSTSMPTPYPDSAARSRERMLALQAYFQRPPGNSQGDSTPLVPSARRSNGNMNLTQGEPGAAVSEQASRTGSSVATSRPTPFPDSAARSRERMLALQAYFQRPPGNSQGDSTPLVPSAGRSNGDMNMTQGEPGAAVSGQASRFLFPSTSS